MSHDDRYDAWYAAKLWNLRVFDDTDGVMNLSAAELGRPVLVVSQFTLYGDTRKGRRPSYVAAARPEVAEPLVERVVAELRSLGATVAVGARHRSSSCGSCACRTRPFPYTSA